MKKLAVLIFCGGVLALHLIATGLYLLPVNPLTKLYAVPVSQYMEPLFTQNWNLFAPEPATSSLKIWLRCEVDGKWQDWKDPIYKLVQEHQENRFSYRGKLIYVYQGISRSLLNHYITQQKKLNCVRGKCLDDVEKEVMQSSEYKLAQIVTSQVCKKLYGEEFAKYQFQLLKVFPRNFSERDSEKPYSKIETVLFSPIQNERG